MDQLQINFSTQDALDKELVLQTNGGQEPSSVHFPMLKIDTETVGKLSSLLDEHIGTEEFTVSDDNMLEFNFSTTAEANSSLGNSLFADTIRLENIDFESVLSQGHTAQNDNITQNHISENASDFLLGLQGRATDFLYSSTLTNDLFGGVFENDLTPVRSYSTSSETVVELCLPNYSDPCLDEACDAVFVQFNSLIPG